MPDQRCGERPRRVLDVYDAPMCRPRGGTGRVEQERMKGEDRALRSEAHGLRPLGSELIDRLWGKPAEAMRTVDDPHWAVRFGTWIEMHTDRQHLLEHIDRGLHVWNASLLRPRSVSGHVDALLRGHGQVLVPDDLPV